MRGTHTNLIVTTTVDDATGSEVPLFHFPVQICKAIESAEPSFERAGPSGAGLQRQEIDSMTGEVVASEDVLRGVRTGDSFSTIPADKIAEIEAATKLENIEVIDTVAWADVPTGRFADGRSFLQVPAKGGSHRFYKATYAALLPAKKSGSTARDAMALKVRWGVRTRQKFGVVYADQDAGCLVLQQLVYSAQVRQPDEQVLSFAGVEVEPEVIGKVRAVLEGLRADEADFDSEQDDLIAHRESLIEQAMSADGIPVPDQTEAPAKVATTDALEDALEASLAL